CCTPVLVRSSAVTSLPVSAAIRAKPPCGSPGNAARRSIAEGLIGAALPAPGSRAHKHGTFGGDGSICPMLRSIPGICRDTGWIHGTPLDTVADAVRRRRSARARVHLLPAPGRRRRRRVVDPAPRYHRLRDNESVP